MKSLIALAVLIFMTSTASALAAPRSEEQETHGPRNISGTLGWITGGPTLSAAYEQMVDPSFGGEVHLRLFSKDSRKQNPADGIIILGAAANHHFYKKNWDLDFAPGFNIMQINSVRTDRDDTILIGPSLGISLTYQINSHWAVGFENSRYWAWLNSDYSGELRDDLSAKVRASF